MLKALIPFWIYWSLLVLGCILFFYMPLLLFLFLPVMLVIIPTWLVIVYLIGDAVSKRGNLDKIRKRIALSFLCSFLTMILFPVGLWISDIIQWGHFSFSSLIRNFHDRTLWILFAIHFGVFWIGEEIGYAAVRANAEGNDKTGDE